MCRYISGVRAQLRDVTHGACALPRRTLGSTSGGCHLVSMATCCSGHLLLWVWVLFREVVVLVCVSSCFC